MNSMKNNPFDEYIKDDSLENLMSNPGLILAFCLTCKDRFYAEYWLGKKVQNICNPCLKEQSK